MSALRELIAKFFVEADTKEVEKAEEKVDGFVEKLKSVGEVVAEAFAFDKIKEFVEGQTEAATQLKRTATMLGTTTDELQAMNLAATEADVTADSMSMGLRVLNRNISEAIHKGGDAAEVFRTLGISLKNQDGTTRAAGDVMQDFADAIASIRDPARQTELAMKVLGRGGAEMLPLLKKGGEAFDDARKQVEELGGGIKEDFIEQAEKSATASAKMHFALDGLKTRIAGALLPILDKFVEMITKLVGKAADFTKHTNVLSTALTFFGAVAGVKAISSLAGLAKKFDLIKPSVLGTVRAFAGFALPLALLGLLYFAVDELYTLLNGGDTLIGDALGPDKQKFIDQLRTTLDQLKDSFKQFGEAVGSDGSAMGTFTTAVVAAGKALAWILDLMEAVIEGGSKIASAFTDLFQGQGFRAIAGFKDIGKVGNPNRDKVDAEDKADTEDQSKVVSSLIRQREIVQEIKKRHEAQASLQGPGGPNSSTIPAYQPGGQWFQGPVFMPPTAGAPAGEHGGVTVNQTNTTNVHVETSSDKPQDIADRVSSGVSTAHQRDMDKARNALRQP